MLNAMLFVLVSLLAAPPASSASPASPAPAPPAAAPAAAASPLSAALPTTSSPSAPASPAAVAASSAPAPSVDSIPSYRCVATTRPVTVDGILDDAAWSAAEWTPDFIDLRGRDRAPPAQRTRAKLLWDDRHLYVAAELTDRDVWATLRRRDDMLYRENAFEIFLDPDADGRQYAELEVNPLNTVFDLTVTRPYRQGGRADRGFTLSGLRTAVRVDGTLNDPRDADGGWTIEIAIPWSSLRGRGIAPDDLLPPRPGSRWRVQLARASRARDEENGTITAWSPAGSMDLHLPLTWGWVEWVER